MTLKKKSYCREFGKHDTDELSNRPPLDMVFRTFRSARFVAYGGAIALTVVLIIIWPAAGYALGVFDYEQFKHWVRLMIFLSIEFFHGILT